MFALECLIFLCGDAGVSSSLEKAEQEKPGTGAPRAMGLAHGCLGLHSCPWLNVRGASVDVLGSPSLWPAAVPQHTMNEDIVSVRLLRGSTPCSISKTMSGAREQLAGLVSRPSPAQDISSSPCVEASRTLFCSTRECWLRDLCSCITCRATCAPGQS